MPPLPRQPKIYHILHVDRLEAVIAVGGLRCDAVMQHSPDSGTIIGMSHIKQRRLTLPVKCHPGYSVADFVPFYFCPRSIMLYIIRQANHMDLAYRGGQDPIVHLEADLHSVIAWAETHNHPWAFTTSNAGAVYTEFYNNRHQLNRIDWSAVASNDFRSSDIKEKKQAEFLFHHFFPWEFIERIGVYSPQVLARVTQTLEHAPHRPRIERRVDWYY